MENQLNIPESPENLEDRFSSAISASPWWEEAGGQLGIGSFMITGADNPVYLNSTLRDWLGLKDDEILYEDDFWESILGLAMNQDQVRAELEPFRKDFIQDPMIQFPLKGEVDGSLNLQLFSLTNPDQSEYASGGFISKNEETQQRVASLVKVYNNLLAPSRQYSAAVLGNLQALSGNWQTWSPEVLDQILGNASHDLDQICHLIDLGLSYAKGIDQTSLFSQNVPVPSLMETIISEGEYSSVNLHTDQKEAESSLVAKIDRSLAKLVLELLIKETVNRNPAGQPVDIIITADEGFVTLTLEGPRTLPLPGLAGKGATLESVESSPEIFLAREILAAQGGDLVVETRQTGAGAGSRFELSLPAAASSPPQPIRQEWRDLFEKGTGRILVAESQAEYQLPIRENLTDQGYRVDLAVDGSTVLDLVQTHQPDLVILARNLPGMDGLLVTQGIRRWSAVPIIMISERENIDDLLYAYRLGVDDYLQKPFVTEELLAKVEVFLSRKATAAAGAIPEIYQEGSVRIDHRTRGVWVRGKAVQLTPIEYNLLVYLSRQGRQIIPYELLLEHVWEGPEKGTRQGLFVHVRRLREKIELNPKDPKILGNKWGVGYVFNP